VLSMSHDEASRLAKGVSTLVSAIASDRSCGVTNGVHCNVSVGVGYWPIYAGAYGVSLGTTVRAIL
jgi:hypothetical protein